MVELKKTSYILLLALFVTATVLIFLGKTNTDNSLKTLLESVSTSLSFVCLLTLFLLTKKETFKNAFLFEVINIIIAIFSIIIIVTYIRDENLDKNNRENTAFIILVSIATFINLIMLFDDVMKLGITKNPKVKLQV